MNLADIIELKELSLRYSLPFEVNECIIFHGTLTVNGLAAIRIENISNEYERNTDLPLYNIAGIEIGYLYFLKGRYIDNLNELSESQFVAYLCDIESANVLLSGESIKVTNDYCVIYKQYLEEYLTHYASSAPLWGKFNHIYEAIDLTISSKIITTGLLAASCNRFNESVLFEASIRGIKQSFAFERFLKYYHLLELNFDFDVVEKLKTLDISTEARNIGSLLEQYKKSDIDRLYYMYEEYCTDCVAIVEKINNISSFLPVAKELFYDFSKDTNPLKDHQTFVNIANSIGGFTFDNCKRFKVQQTTNNDTYNKFIGRLSMYWVYRIRNSIAHNKIGEYLMLHKDEKFIVDFAEPLLLAVLMQVFK